MLIINQEDKYLAESFKTRILRLGFNLHPVIRRSGGRLTYISDDLKHVKLKIPLNRKTKNYVGTIYGGSMYSAVDPIYMVMFIKLLGPGYIVWDKSASIQYLKPGRSTLNAEFLIDDTELSLIRKTLDKEGKTDRVYCIELRDMENVLCAVIEKTLHFRKREILDS